MFSYNERLTFLKVKKNKRELGIGILEEKLGPTSLAQSHIP